MRNKKCFTLKSKQDIFTLLNMCKSNLKETFLKRAKECFSFSLFTIVIEGLGIKVLKQISNIMWCLPEV